MSPFVSRNICPPLYIEGIRCTEIAPVIQVLLAQHCLCNIIRRVRHTYSRLTGTRVAEPQRNQIDQYSEFSEFPLFKPSQYEELIPGTNAPDSRVEFFVFTRLVYRVYVVTSLGISQCVTLLLEQGPSRRS